jgi:hypothetical protein
MRQPYFLAVCDILGFSQLVESTPLDVVVTDVLGWFRKAVHHSIHQKDFPLTVPNRAETEQHELVGVAWFSDTVLLYTKKDTDDAVRQLLNSVGWLIFENMLYWPTRIRAGLAYGDAFIDPDNSLFVGKPIVEAYRLEQHQEWSGAALAQSACDRVPERVRSGQFADWWVVPYAVPLKDNASFDTLAVNWNWGIHDIGWRMRWCESSDMPSERDWSTRPSVCAKFVNTKQFHEAFCHDCKRLGA